MQTTQGEIKPGLRKQKDISYILPRFFVLVPLFIIMLIINLPMAIGIAPSSTIGLAIIPIILILFIFGVVGSIVARFIKSLAKVRVSKLTGDAKDNEFNRIQKIGLRIVISIVVIAVLFLFLDFLPEIKSYINANTPGVKFNSGLVKKIDKKSVVIVEHRNLLDCDTLFIERFNKSQNGRYVEERTIEWHGDEIKFSLNQNEDYFIYNTNTEQTIENLLENYGYIVSVSLFPYEKSGKFYLFVLTNLRDGSLFTVYKYPGEVVYNELLVAPNDSDLILGFGKSDGGEDIITIADFVGKQQPPYYRICYLNRKFTKEDFQLLNYVYQIR